MTHAKRLHVGQDRRLVLRLDTNHIVQEVQLRADAQPVSAASWALEPARLWGRPVVGSRAEPASARP